MIAIVGAVFIGVGGFVVVEAVSSGDPLKSLFGLVLIAIGVLVGLAGIAYLRVSRMLRRLARTSRSALGDGAPPARTAPAVPPGELVIDEHRIGDGVTSHGTEAPRGTATLFLWVFDDAQTTSLFRRLQRLGPVYVLRGGGALVDDLLLDAPKMAFGRTDRFIEETEAEVEQRMATFSDRRNWLGIYRTQAMTCSDQVWTFALDRLLERVEIVLVDLSDFTPGHVGIEYELALLIDRVPLDRVILVTGSRTDRAVLDTTLQHLWSTMPDTSPNHAARPVAMHIAATTTLDESGTKRDNPKAALQDRELGMILEMIGDAADRVRQR